MRTNHFFICLILNTFFISATAYSQATNFDQTWKEFLENNKISKMSELVKPDKVREQLDYAKYLLMNANTDFCQTRVEDAENLMSEIQGMDSDLHEAIPGFVGKMEEIETKIEAYHSIDAIWKRFLQTQEVTQDELEAVEGAGTNCEKSTLAKYSYMTAYYNFCQGEVSRAKNIFENRTLRLTEKTTLRVKDVEGLATQVAKMKSLFQDLAKLDAAWNSYVKTGVSPGFDIEFQLFPCYPVPRMKALVLKGATDLCGLAPAMLEEVKQLQIETGVAPEGELAEKIKDLEAAIQQDENKVAALNEAWEAFIPNNEVPPKGSYGYEYCSKEPLIRAYIMDGFASVCGKAEAMLEKIDSLQRQELTPLEQITMVKINELAALSEQSQANGVKIEQLWDKFVAQGDTLYQDYRSPNLYCDYIHEVKDWTMKGLSSTCEEGTHYLEQIEEFQRNFNFKFAEELECRVRKLKIRVWNCRYAALQKLARLEAPDAQEKRLKELMQEYGMGERPEACALNE